VSTHCGGARWGVILVVVVTAEHLPAVIVDLLVVVHEVLPL